MKEIVFIALAFAAPAAMADIHCSDATGHITYLSTQYNRGIPPQDGDVIRTMEVRIDGKLVSRSVAYQGSKPPVLGPINPDFMSKVMLQGDTYKSDFAALMVLSQNKENATVVLTQPEQAYVICHQEFYPVP